MRWGDATAIRTEADGWGRGAGWTQGCWNGYVRVTVIRVRVAVIRVKVTVRVRIRIVVRLGLGLGLQEWMRLCCGAHHTISFCCSAGSTKVGAWVGSGV